MDHAGRSLKSQMKRADKLKSLYTLILGEREISENKALLDPSQSFLEFQLRPSSPNCPVSQVHGGTVHEPGLY